MDRLALMGYSDNYTGPLIISPSVSRRLHSLYHVSKARCTSFSVTSTSTGVSNTPFVMFTRMVLLMTVACARGVYPPDSSVVFQDEQQSQQHYHQQQPSDYQSQERVVEKREVTPTPTLAPQWGFIPLIAGAGLGWGAPPVIQVHHIVQIQSPNQRCIPFPSPQPTPGQGYPTRPTGAGRDGIETRFGESNDTTTKNPSPCVWAIVSCCSPGNANIRYSCFELLGCQGAFWDLSPCEPRVVQAAANTALMFYMAASPPNNQSNVIDFEAPESESVL
ncbi:hypothetical protein GE061_016678 [Apolygus lucorum]|uniref:Uncharacterized protein n=1 Tax=Apolygus lucorum TaxID=248454 RepID=A0A8S9XJI7_APOLU|nr:hypothetical protein GE061_016678 [Apolygus lucorum]